MLALLLPVALAGAPLEGSWRLVSDPVAVRAVQKEETARALAGVPTILHPLAERALEPAYKICTTYRIAVSSEFSVQCDGAPPLQGPPDGVNRERQVDGEIRSVSVRRDGDDVVLIIHNEEGSRATRYMVTPAGLRVSVTVASMRLAAPINWSLDYRPTP